MIIRSVLLPLAVWLVGGLAQACEPDASATAAARGEVWSQAALDAEGAATVTAAIDIAAGPQAVWSAITDCRSALRFIAELKTCRVLQTGPGWSLREQDIRTFGPFSMRNVVRSDYQPYRVIRFRRDSGELKIDVGEWDLSPINGGAATHVVYCNRVKAGLPAGVVLAHVREGTPRMMLALRREAVAAQGH